MDIKKKITATICFVIGMTTWSQTANCQDMETCRTNNMVVAIGEYVSEFPMENGILLIDHALSDDGIDIFWIIWSYDPLEMFYKKPDTVFILDSNIVYVNHYKETNRTNDTIWLNEVFTQTWKMFGIPLPDSINWKKGELINQNSYKVCSIYTGYYVVEYHVRNGKILQRLDDVKMFYPDTNWSVYKRSKPSTYWH